MMEVVMKIDTGSMISITEANQNFSRATRLADQKGSVTILKNNAPRYLLIPFSVIEQDTYAADADVLEIAKQLIKENMKAYEVLAK